MTETKSIVLCPQCSFKVKLSTQYDEDIDETVVCPQCNWIASKWNFEFFYQKEE